MANNSLNGVDTAEPEWSKNFLSEEEAFLAFQDQKLSDEIAEKMKAKEEVAKAIKEAQVWKQLFLASGEGFRNWVKKALEELGMKVEHGPKGHADLMGRYGEALVMIEAKAIAAAARKPDISQAADYGDEIEQALEFTGDELGEHHREYLSIIQKLGVSVERLRNDKSFLKKMAVLNTSRADPLDKRIEPAFPPAAVAEMKARAVAGLTGIQLLGILSACRAGRLDKAKAMEEILSSAGQYKDFQNWQNFLKPKGAESQGSYLLNP